MDALIRVMKTSFSQRKWSFQLLGEEDNLALQIYRLDISGGWDETFRVLLQNHLGERQLIEILPSNDFEAVQQVSPYIAFRLRPERRFWKIPPYIFQTWKIGPKTPEMEAAIQTFRGQPGYTHICWDDNECYSFLLQAYGERHASAFKNLVPGAYRADFWRYCMLYKFGGVYSDAKATLLRPLDEILRPDDELVLVRDLPKTCLLNGFMACSPKHPLLEIVINMVLEQVESHSYGEDPLDICGPHLLGRAFCRWKGKEDDKMDLQMGYTYNMQILGRSEDKKDIISPEGEALLVKEYDSYYKNDVNVSVHYPQLWSMRAVYADQPPWKK